MQNLKPAVVKIYDYYQPSETSMTSPVITILIPSRTYVYCDCSSIPLLSFLSGDQDDTEYIYTCATRNKLLQFIKAA